MNQWWRDHHRDRRTRPLTYRLRVVTSSSPGTATSHSGTVPKAARSPPACPSHELGRLTDGWTDVHRPRRPTTITPRIAPLSQTAWRAATICSVLSEKSAARSTTTAFPRTRSASSHLADCLSATRWTRTNSATTLSWRLVSCRTETCDADRIYHETK